MSKPSTTADEILRCARVLLTRGGYDSFSYADISDVVGIRKASIHHHFPGKADLVHALVAQYRQEADAGIDELERTIPDPLDRLRAYLGYWEGCIVDATHPFCICALLATEIPVLPEAVVLEVRAHFRRLSAWLASVLECGAAQGRIALAGTAETEAEMFVATVHGAMLSARASGEAGMFGAITRHLLERITP